MSKLFIEDLTLIAIADAIREKEGTTAKVPVTSMATRITDLPSGGGGNEPTDEELTITGNCGYRFASNGWNWFIEKYGNRITTKDIVDCNFMFFQSSNLTELPFDINLSSKFSGNIASVFSYATSLTEAPLIVGNLPAVSTNYSGNPNISSVFDNCYSLRYIPHNYFSNFGGTAFWESAKNYTGKRERLFALCYSLRQLPDLSMLPSSNTGTTSTLYYYLCYNTYSLDELVDLPVLAITITSNLFSSTITSCYRLKNFTFATNEDGTAKTANWKSQTIDLSKNIGYESTVYQSSSMSSYLNASPILKQNSGITRDKLVYDDDTYQALKNDPDWFTAAWGNTSSPPYSRYNFESAVATINSLPDTSAYLATAGGTNTIKFNRAGGSATDGGSFSTHTEEEVAEVVAVAAAKGWTVTLV